MKLSDVEKLYKKLSPEQSAAMAFEAMLRQDKAELRAITDSQPKQYFIGASLAYRSHLGGLTNLGLLYGVIYWKSRTELIYGAYSGNIKAIDKAKANLGSMELALVKTCLQLCVSVESVKKLGLITGEDSYGEFAEEALTVEYAEVFMSGSGRD